MAENWFDGYDVPVSMMGKPPSWLSEHDARRLSAYATYDALYWNDPGTSSMVLRGNESNPIQVPTPRMLINAINRYLAVGFDWTITGSSTDAAALALALDDFARREEFLAKFTENKRWGLIRGDSAYHITADPSKDPGRRISITTLDPGSLFPIPDVDDVDKIVGYHIVDRIEDPARKGRFEIYRQTYRRDDAGFITTERTVWEEGAWDDRPNSTQDRSRLKLLRVIRSATRLPIRTFPVYHIKNQWMSGAPFGFSELRGYERLAIAINQAVTDEELALALEGLGVYVTNSGPPRDESGNVIDWHMGPGEVVELQGDDATMSRLSGISSVQPYQDHIKFIQDSMTACAGLPAVALGQVDASIAASGIALELHMRPLLAENEEREVQILSVHDHMLFDLVREWFPVYEQQTFADDIRVEPYVGNPLPRNRAAIVAELVALMGTTPPIISAETARTVVRDELGYAISDDESTAVTDEAAAHAEAAEPASARLAAEAAALGLAAAGQPVPAEPGGTNAGA